MAQDRVVNKPRVMFCGPSGTGKTTIAKWLAEKLDVPFLDLSRTTIIPADRGKTHQEMLNMTGKEYTEKNLQILSARRKAVYLSTGIDVYQVGRESEGNLNGAGFVSDRSFLDPLAYQLFEATKDTPPCDTQHIWEVINQLLQEHHISHIIYMPFTNEMISEWVTEDNNKRITNPYFQRVISKCFDMALEMFNISLTKSHKHLLGNIPLIMLYNYQIDLRKKMICDWLTELHSSYE